MKPLYVRIPKRHRIAFRPRADEDNDFIERITRQELVPTLERAWQFTWDDGHARKFMLDLLTVGETLIVSRHESTDFDTGTVHLSDISSREAHATSEQKGEPIGYVWFILQPKRRLFFAPSVFWINYLVVKHTFQGQGIGTQIMALCADRARRAGCGRMELWVQNDNVRAFNFYKRLGFKARRPVGGNIPMFRKP